MGSGIRIDIEDTWEYERPRLSVYLACSLTSDENSVFKREVLFETERIFTEAGVKVYNPAHHTPLGSPHTDSEVYLEDLWHPVNSDYIFFLRLGRSHGMGIEAQLAADVLLPWGDARSSGDSYVLSPLLAGLANAKSIWRGTICDDNLVQFYGSLAESLRDQSRMKRLRDARHARDSAHGLVHAAEIGCQVRIHRLICGLSSSNLGTLTGIDPTLIDALEAEPRFVSKLTLVQLARLCETLEMTFASSQRRDTPSFPRVATPTGVDSALFAAAKTFAEYSLGSGSPATRRTRDDASLLSHWQDWLKTKNLTVLERRLPRSPFSTEPIRVFLCPPLSNVLEAEKKALDGLVNEITRSLKGSGVPVEIQTPTVQQGGRPDHGPEIYLNRVAQLRHTDLAIPLLGPPSTGVGIMLQLIINATIPCLCATRNWAEVSRMVRGLAPSELPYIEYSSPESLGSDVAKWLRQHADQIRQSRVLRDQAWLRLRGLDIRRAMTLARIVQAEVSEMPLLREEFLEQLADSKEMTGTLTLLQLAYVANTQGWHLISSRSGILALEPRIGDLAPNTPNREMAAAAARASLGTLWDAMEECQPALDEAKARHAWSSFLAELTPDAARKEKRVRTVEDLARTKKEWLKVFRAKEQL
jgi:hypothetical protein